MSFSIISADELQRVRTVDAAIFFFAIRYNRMLRFGNKPTAQGF
jgi:hypothetical protein